MVISNKAIPPQKTAKLSPFDPEEAGTECDFRFGETGAVLFWSYCLLSSERRQDLAAWGKKLLSACSSVNPTIRYQRKNKAGHRLPNLTKIDRGLASRWARANPLPSLDYPITVPGSADVLPALPSSILLLPMFFSGDAEHPWQSHVLFIYDRHTRTLFHRFLTLRPNVILTADWILHTLALMLQKIARVEEEADFCLLTSLIQIPVPSDDPNHPLKPYEEAFDRLKTAHLAGKDCKIAWLRTESLRIHPAQLYPVAVRSPEVTTVTLNFKTAREFATVVTRISHKFQNDEHSSWISLTPPKAIRRLDPNRYVRPKPIQSESKTV